MHKLNYLKWHNKNLAYILFFNYKLDNDNYLVYN